MSAVVTVKPAKTPRAKGRSRERRPQPQVLPTAERVAQAGGDYLVTRDGYVRVTDAPLERMFSRRQLSSDERIAEAMYEAGRRWRSDWFLSGLSGPGAINYASTARGEGNSPWGMPVSVRSAEARQQFRKARLALGATAATVGAIVLDETPTVDVGRFLAQRRDRTIATAAAMEQLRDGLHKLAVHYGYLRSARV
jgi:hypothetical protein